jgi:hypothetical protein
MCLHSTPCIITNYESHLTSTCAMKIKCQIICSRNYHQHQQALYLVLGPTPSSSFEKHR